MRTWTPLRKGRRVLRLHGLPEGSPRPGCSVPRTVLPPAGPAPADPMRPHLSATHDVAPPGPAALEPRRQAHRQLPQTAPSAETPQPGERSHRARCAHAHTAHLAHSRAPCPLPAHGPATNQRPPARGLSGVVVRPWISGSRSEAERRARGRRSRVCRRMAGLGPSLLRGETWGQRVDVRGHQRWEDRHLTNQCTC